MIIAALMLLQAAPAFTPPPEMFAAQTAYVNCLGATFDDAAARDLPDTAFESLARANCAGETDAYRKQAMLAQNEADRAKPGFDLAASTKKGEAGFAEMDDANRAQMIDDYKARKAKR